ncbi:MAG: helix-turn-helix domain-containing protein [Eubacteriales bacterium]
MNNNQTYSKKLCMKELLVQKVRFNNPHYYESGIGDHNSAFGFITMGSVILKSPDKVIEIGEGGLFYIPDGIRCHLIWRGNPDVEFYSIGIISKHPENSSVHRYSMTGIPEMSDRKTLLRIESIYHLLASGIYINEVRAIAQYYDFFADVLSYMHPNVPVQYNPALLAAIDYIEKNYNRDFDMAEIASGCYISESRLYHLFQKELGTTPIKYRNDIRVEKASSELRGGSRSVEDIAASCGIQSNAYFRKLFRDITGMTPSEYRSMTGIKTRSDADSSVCEA